MSKWINTAIVVKNEKEAEKLSENFGEWECCYYDEFGNEWIVVFQMEVTDCKYRKYMKMLQEYTNYGVNKTDYGYLGERDKPKEKEV